MSTNPTDRIALDFAAFVEKRRSELAVHTDPGGIADYAFGLDGRLRRRIAALGPVRSVAQALVALEGPIQKQMQRMGAVAVGPRQYPELHALGEECARRLGVDVPQIFLQSMPPGAFTMACDDASPFVVLSSTLALTLNPAELLFVLGHECGHVHNLHGVYNSAAELMANPLASGLIRQTAQAGIGLGLIRSALPIQVISGLVQGGLRLFFLHWSRCAEVTCDRAGLICCGDPAAAESALLKIVTGGISGLAGFDGDEYLRQMRQARSTPFRFQEMLGSHPTIQPRIEALRAFASCEVLYAWRPDLQPPDALHEKEETDALCERILDVVRGPVAEVAS